MLITILILLAAWILWSLVTLYRNYRLAQTTGLPIVLEPVSTLNLLWLITDGLTKQISWLRPLRDKFVRRFMPFSYFGWQFDQGHSIHRKYGPVFVLVSPGGIQISVGHPAVAYDIMTRRKDFIKPAAFYDQLNAFGPNVNTVEGEIWQRHRRLTAPSFNERVSSSVWDVARQQSQQFREKWLRSESTGISTTADDTATLALNVLTIVGLGQDIDFGTKAQSEKRMPYNSAIRYILQKYPFLIIFPIHYLSAPIMPRFLRQLGEACNQFKAYIAELLSQERMRIDRADHSTNNLLSNLVRAADAEKNDKSSIGMTDIEIYGNMFIFTLAGHETTANTIATAIVYLARYPKYQAWIREELQHVLNDKDAASQGYEACFPRLKRCLAVMYETLRVHGSVVVIPKTTHSRPETIDVKGKQHIIPPNTLIMINNHATQTHPDSWGPDSEHWKPDRWIKKTSDSRGESSPDVDTEELVQPANGTFSPWADGPRSCLGKKFSQVEFVAVLATLFLDCEVKPTQILPLRHGNTVNDEVDAMLKDSEITTATLQMRQPKRVNMAWRLVNGIS